MDNIGETFVCVGNMKKYVQMFRKNAAHGGYTKNHEITGTPDCRLDASGSG